MTSKLPSLDFFILCFILDYCSIYYIGYDLSMQLMCPHNL